MTTRASSDTLDAVLRESVDATEPIAMKPHIYILPGECISHSEASPYSRAINDDGEEESNCKPRKRVPVLVMIILITLSIFWATVATVGSRRKVSSRPTSVKDLPCYCGTTLAEARSLNCVYVAMSSAWLPPHCRDDALAAEFESAGPGPNGTWSYFADEAMTLTMSHEEVAALGGSEIVYYTTWEWHVVHCLFYWRKLHRAQTAKGLILEPRFNTDAHIHHCAKLILTKGGGNGSTTSGVVMGKESVPAEMLMARVWWGDLRDGMEMP